MLNNVACKSLPSENMPVENRTHSVLSETDVSTRQVIKRTILWLKSKVPNVADSSLI